MPDQDLDQDVLDSIRNQNANPSTFGDQMSSLWGALTTPGLGLSKPPSYGPGQVPYSSNFGSVDEWQKYNQAMGAQNAQAPDPTSDPTGPLSGIQAGMGASQLPGMAPPSAAASASPSMPSPLKGSAMGGQIASLGNVQVPGMQTLPPDASVRQAIAQKYGFGPNMDAAALQAAQQKQQQGNLISNLGEAGNDIASAFAAGRGSTKPADNKYYQELRDQAAQPAQNIMALRQAKLGDLAASNQFSDNDPNSPVSKAVQDAYIKLGFPEDSVRQLSSADLKNIQSPAELSAKIQSQKDMKQLGLAQIQSNKDLAMNNKQTDKIASAYKDTMNDRVVSQAKGQLAQADELMSATNDATQNPVSANALAALAARYVSGGQRINRQEMEALGGGAKDVSDKLNQIMQTGSKGTLSPENAAFMQKFVSVTRQSAQQSYQSAVKDRADSYAKIYGVDPNSLYDKFGVNNRAAGGGGNQQQSSAFGMHAPGATVTVKGKQYVVGADGDTLTPAGGTFATQ